MKTAVVTGAARGIGEALALGAHRAGYAVVCCDIDGDGAARTATCIDSEGGTALGVATDVTNVVQVRTMVDAALELTGRIDVLFSNAGGSRGGLVPFLEISQDEWVSTLELNLSSGFYVGQAVARHMAANGGGAIVYTSSQLSSVTVTGLAHYCSAKGGLAQLVRAMALELAPVGVRVNAIAPGPTETPGISEALRSEDVRERHRRTIPMGRVGQPEEMVGAALYLASDAASFTTGTTVFVDGGYTIV